MVRLQLLSRLGLMVVPLPLTLVPYRRTALPPKPMPATAANRFPKTNLLARGAGALVSVVCVSLTSVLTSLLRQPVALVPPL